MSKPSINNVIKSKGLRSRENVAAFLSKAKRMQLPRYEVDSHGTLTENLRTFTVPKNTAIIHFTMPGLTTFMRPQPNTLGTLFTKKERKHLLSGDAQWRDNRYSVMYIDGDTIPDLHLTFSCPRGKMGIYNMTKRKTVMSYNTSPNTNATNNTNASNTSCRKLLSTVVREQGPGVYFVVACRPMHPNAMDFRRLTTHQERNVLARARYTPRGTGYYSSFIGTGLNAGNVLSRVLADHMTVPPEIVKFVSSHQRYMRVVQKVSGAISRVRAKIGARSAQVEHFEIPSRGGAGVVILLLAALIVNILQIAFGKMQVYMSARGMQRLRASLAARSTTARSIATQSPRQPNQVRPANQRQLNRPRQSNQMRRARK